MAGNVAAYPGSFDPFTLGHMDILQRASKLFETVYVVVAHNANKSHLFSGDQRLEIVERSVTHLRDHYRMPEEADIRVRLHTGITSDFLDEHNVDVVIRGIRNATDLDHEIKLEQYLRRTSTAETVYLTPRTRNLNTSSTLVRMFLQTGKFEEAGRYMSTEAQKYIVDTLT
jgi:pantetheine-phosphate adenylyltransferase